MRSIFLSIAYLTSIIFINAQVTIGSKLSPSDGSLLDLKENNLEVNSTKGLLLPRVELIKMSELKPMFSYQNNDIPSSSDLLNHAGLIVYNVNNTENKDHCPTGISSGLYTWSGSEWTPITGKGDYREDRIDDASTIIDNRDPSNTVTYYIGYFEEAGWWMLENLRADRFPNGTLINRGLPQSHSYGAMYNYPIIATSTIMPSSPTSVSRDLVDRNPEYGYLYSWEAATAGKSLEGGDDSSIDTGIQGICPDGWHIPSRNEWIELFNMITDAEKYEICVYSNVLLPDESTAPVKKFFAAMLSPETVEGGESIVSQVEGCSVPYEEGGFNFLSTGICSSTGYYRYGDYTRAWTSSRGPKTGTNEYNAYMVAFNLSNIESYQSENNITAWYSNAMIPVRCKKD